MHLSPPPQFIASRSARKTVRASRTRLTPVAVATPRGSQPRREWGTFEVVRNKYEAGGFNRQQAEALIGGTETLLGGVLERFDERFDQLDERLKEKDEKDEKRYNELYKEVEKRYNELGVRFEGKDKEDEKRYNELGVRLNGFYAVIALLVLAIFLTNSPAADIVKYVFPFLPK